MIRCRTIPNLVKLILLSLITLIVVTPVQGNSEDLRVGVAGSAPFNFSDRYPPEGVSVDLWKVIAAEQNISYQLIPQPRVKAGIEAVSRGELDILIGPISITAERLEQVQFTQPYFSSEIGLLISSDSISLWTSLKPFFRLAVLSSIAALILALFAVGNFLWLAERRRNPEQFPKEYPQGIASGMWFALVTLTTVGYGDKAPVTKTGKIITAVWMVITMVTASSLTAGLATAFTLSLSGQTAEEFSAPETLKNQTISVVMGTTGAEWGRNYQGRLVETNNLEQAIEVLLEKDARGVIFDVPALEYYLHQNPQAKLRLADFIIAGENYGFVLSLDNPLVHDLNVEIVKMREEGQIQAIVDRWIR